MIFLVEILLGQYFRLKRRLFHPFFDRECTILCFGKNSWFSRHLFSEGQLLSTTKSARAKIPFKQLFAETSTIISKVLVLQGKDSPIKRYGSPLSYFHRIISEILKISRNHPTFCLKTKIHRARKDLGGNPLGQKTIKIFSVLSGSKAFLSYLDGFSCRTATCTEISKKSKKDSYFSMVNSLGKPPLKILGFVNPREMVHDLFIRRERGGSIHHHTHLGGKNIVPFAPSTQPSFCSDGGSYGF